MHRRNSKKKLDKNNIIKLIVVMVDLIIIDLSYVAAFYIRFAAEVRATGALPMFNYEPFLVALPFMTLSSLIYIDIFGLLRFYRTSWNSIASSILKLVFMQTLTTTAITYFLSYSSFPRSILIITPIFQTAALILWNWAMLSVRDSGAAISNVMIIGNAEQRSELEGKLERARTPISRKMSIKYTFCADDREKAIKCIRKVDEVLICSDLSEEFKMEIMLMCIDQRKAVYLAPEVMEISLISTEVVHFDDMPLLLMDSFSLSFEQRFFKRAFDLAASILSMPILLPFFAIIAALIKLTSPGGVFYRQERVTAGGRIYSILKFRTMYDGAELETGPTLSYDGDERVTALGKFLRRYRIDELPQLFNVIKGDMSLVGPRSERPYFVEQYIKNIDGYEMRNAVRAGITGYAQIFGKYGTPAEHKLTYDLIYIKNYSLLLDIKLIMQTISVIFRKGSS